MPDVSVRLANVTDRPIVGRLWLMFRHDMSEFNDLLPQAGKPPRELGGRTG